MNEFNLEDFIARSTDRSFLDTILSVALSHLPRLTKEGPWLAGGALRRTVSGGQADSDFDFFFRDASQLESFVRKLEVQGLEKIKETEHHLHYRGRVGDSAIPIDVQCIRFSFYTSAKSVIDSFDYTICQLAYDGQTLTVGDYTLWDLGRKRLAINKITYPVSTMRRMLKYTSQGFYACAGCMASILKATAENPALLEALHITYVD